MGIMAISIFVGGCTNPGLVPMGRDTYMLSRPGGFFTVADGEVKSELYREANEYCRRENRYLMPLSSSSRDAAVAQYASAEIQFRCLAEGDPELRRPDMEPVPNVSMEMRTK